MDVLIVMATTVAYIYSVSTLHINENDWASYRLSIPHEVASPKHF